MATCNENLTFSAHFHEIVENCDFNKVNVLQNIMQRKKTEENVEKKVEAPLPSQDPERHNHAVTFNSSNNNKRSEQSQNNNKRSG